MHSTGDAGESLIVALMSVVILVHKSLETGNPLPAVLPTPLVAKIVAKNREAPRYNKRRAKKNCERILRANTGDNM
jgi:hypothetical protein